MFAIPRGGDEVRAFGRRVDRIEKDDIIRVGRILVQTGEGRMQLTIGNDYVAAYDLVENCLEGATRKAFSAVIITGRRFGSSGGENEKNREKGNPEHAGQNTACSVSASGRSQA